MIGKIIENPLFRGDIDTYVVNLPVSSQIATLSKLLVTDVTLIWLVASVSSDVDLESA